MLWYYSIPTAQNHLHSFHWHLKSMLNCPSGLATNVTSGIGNDNGRESNIQKLQYETRITNIRAARYRHCAIKHKRVDVGWLCTRSTCAVIYPSLRPPVPVVVSRTVQTISRMSARRPRSRVHTAQLYDPTKTCRTRRCSWETCASTLLDSTTTHTFCSVTVLHADVTSWWPSSSASCGHSSVHCVTHTGTNYGDRSFSVNGPVIWNSLSHDLWSTDISLSTFRKRLEAFLFDSWHSTLAACANLGFTSDIIIIIIVILLL